jgi:hypothetical protein
MQIEPNELLLFLKLGFKILKVEDLEILYRVFGLEKDLDL